MTWIEDNAISVQSSETTNRVKLTVGVDVRFTGVDMFQGQTGAAKFSVLCTIWEEDKVFDDRITMQEHVMEPGSIFEVTGFEMIFDLPSDELYETESWIDIESFDVELYGVLTLMKNGLKHGPGGSVKTGTVKARVGIDF
jgi:hypothetical protein